MSDYKPIVVVFLATAILIGGLATFVAYNNGELELLGATKAPIEGVEVPLAPPTETAEEQKNISSTPSGTASMTNSHVTFKTNQGDITLELFEDRMPITAGNFLKLAREGFYTGTKFHRIIDGFMIQGGDPNSKGSDASTYGRGGPGYAIKDEFVSGLSNVRGTIAMANSGPNSGGSQFFINLVDNTNLDFDKPPLTSQHPVFGKITEGMDIVDTIAKLPKDSRDVPLHAVVIESVEVK